MLETISTLNLDIERYEQCVLLSEQYNGYALVDFLNAVASWEVVVYKEYEAVMPVPYVKKWGVKIVVMPIFCQQLGVFSSKDEVALNEKFLDYLYQNYNVLTYSFNASNSFKSNLLVHENYIIPCSDYKDVFKKYSTSRKRNIKKAGKSNLHFSLVCPQEACREFFMNYVKGIPPHKREKYWKYISHLIEIQLFIPIGGYVEGQLQSLAICLKTSRELKLCLLIHHPKLRDKNIPSALVDYLLRHYISTLDFSFVGSQIPNVAEFNQRFGAQKTTFKILKQSKYSVIKSLIFK